MILFYFEVFFFLGLRDSQCPRCLCCCLLWMSLPCSCLYTSCCMYPWAFLSFFFFLIVQIFGFFCIQIFILILSFPFSVFFFNALIPFFCAPNPSPRIVTLGKFCLNDPQPLRSRSHPRPPVVCAPTSLTLLGNVLAGEEPTSVT